MDRRIRLRESRLERLVPGVESLVQLRIGDHERAEHPDAVRMDAGLQEQHATPSRLLRDTRCELRSGLFRAAVLDELECEHRTEPTDVPDLRVALLPCSHPAAYDLSDALGAVDETLLLEHVEDCDRRRLR